MAYFKCSTGGGSSVEIDGVAYDGDLKLKEKTYSIKLDDLPCTFKQGTVVEYDGEINIIPDRSTSIYRKTENGWVQRNSMPSYVHYGYATIYEGNLYIRADKYLYMHNREDDTWTTVRTGSYSVSSTGGSGGSILATDKGIYAFAGASDNASGSNTVCQVIHGSGSRKSLPMAFNYSKMVYHEGNIHMLGSSSYASDKYKHYRFDASSSTWTLLGELPCTVSSTPVISTKKGICIVTNSTCYYLIDGTWEAIEGVPYEIVDGGAIEYNDDIHVMGGSKTFYTKDNSTGTAVYPYSTYEFIINKKVYLIE